MNIRIRIKKNNSIKSNWLKFAVKKIFSSLQKKETYSLGCKKHTYNYSSKKLTITKKVI